MSAAEENAREAFFEALGEEVAEAQDATLEARRDLAAVRARLLSRPRHAHPPRRVAGPSLAAVALVGAVAASAALVTQLEGTAALHYSVDGARGATGDWVSSGEASQRVRFSDGSETRLAPHSSLRVAELMSEGARLDLQRGALHAQVIHRDDTRWRIHAGPFEVRVVGTTFDVAWDPDSERFDLHLEEGRVVVSGPTVAERVVAAGETVTVELEQQRMEVVQLDVPEPTPTTAAQAEPSSEAAPTKAPPRAARLRLDWRRLARQARHTEAVEAARWDRELATAPAGELLLLGDAARLSSAPERARAAYRAVRTRFPGTHHAAQAAFLLGRLAMRGGDASDAAAWFERAVAEDPGGPYSSIAAGRRIDAYQRAGNEVAAQRAARHYLSHHPDGAHSELARSLLAAAMRE